MPEGQSRRRAQDWILCLQRCLLSPPLLGWEEVEGAETLALSCRILKVRGTPSSSLGRQELGPCHHPSWFVRRAGHSARCVPFISPEDAAVKGRLVECLETVLNKAQEPPKSKKVQHSNAKNAILFETISLIIHYDRCPPGPTRA